MSQPTPDLPSPEELARATRAQVAQIQRWRRLWGVTFGLLVCFLALGSFTVAEIHENNTKRDHQIAGLEDIAADIDAATGPEAQARQALVIQQLVDAIDCSQRAAFQEALDVLVEQGILEQRIIVRPTDCQEQP